MSARSLLMSAAGNAGERLYVDDVFSAWTYNGTGAPQTIINGIDLAGKGGMVHGKCRSLGNHHRVFDTSSGTGKALYTSLASAQGSDATELTAFNSDGFTLGAGDNVNGVGATNVAWTFRNAKDFFQVLSVTKSAGSSLVIDLSPYMTTPGMVKVKRTDAAGSWYTWHRSLTAGQLLIGETTAAAATLGQITVVGTTLTLVNGVIADGTYHVEAYAHDTGVNGLIQCGITGAGAQTISIGWEPQLVSLKPAIGAFAVQKWVIADTARGMSASPTNTATLAPNSSAAEVANDPNIYPTATGFTLQNNDQTNNAIYCVIRRSNKPPTTGTQVYNAVTYAGDGSASTGQVVDATFPMDLAFTRYNRSGAGDWDVISRLQGLSWSSGGSRYLNPHLTSAEAVGGYLWAISQTQVKSYGHSGATTQLNHFFKRAPGVHDHICYGGTASNKTEVIPVLGVPAELWLVKGRSGATQWVWGSSLLASTEKIVMPSPNGRVTDATAWNSTYPTATALSLGTAAAVNTAAATYVAYLWATLAGVSKVFGYTGNGSTQPINCGFTTGGRFVMIIRTTAGTAQDIFIWDTARGIVAGNDPHLSLNSTAAEVTTDDSIDPDASGFIVNQLAATNINVNGATYIGLAYA
jgi:hypothetical protein